MANARIALADFTEIRRWSFDTPPTIGLVLRSPDGLIYPRRRRAYNAVIDTGFEYEILVSRDVYNRLQLRQWEYPEQRTFEFMDGRLFRCFEAISDITIARTDIAIPEVPIVTPIDDDGKTYIIIGSDFLKRLQLLLLGNHDQPEIVLLRHR